MNFTQIVGLDSAKQALMLLAVDPSLGGVAMAATVGSGKSTLARAFIALLPEGTPFVELPLNITEDRLIGGLNLEATLATGQRVVEPGVLARAHGGVVYVDALNLLDDIVVTHIMDAMGRGEVHVEREGISAHHPAQFMLVGTYDLSDGDVRPSLLDRIGLIVPFTPNNEAGARAEVVRRNIHRKGVSEEEADDELELLRGMIAFARTQLGQVQISDEQLEGLSKAALQLGIEGNRVDVIAARAAIAHAALSGRDAVDEEDLQLAAKLVLMPRATRIPEQEQEEAKSQEPQAKQPQPPQSNDESPDDEKDDNQQQQQPEIQEMLMEAIETDLPSDVMQLPFVMAKRGKSGGRGTQLNDKRGRFVRAIPGELSGHRLALVPTLLAAAPWQKMRRKTADGGRKKTVSGLPSSVLIVKDDLRIKKLRDKAGTLFIFVVDASGSMALNRMRQAKGAVAKLLQSAYVHRDQVALIAFRGQQAQMLMPPSTSVERAKRELDVLPTGGGTPLASALVLAWQTALQARRKNIPNATLIVMTDGRGNVALNAANPEAAKDKSAIEAELQQLSGLIQVDRINAVVIDTQANYLSRGEAPKLAQWLGGRYVYLPGAKAEQIASVVSGEAHG